MKSKINLILILIVTGVIWINSCLPANESQELSMGIVYKVAAFVKNAGIQLSLPDLEYIVRKLAHFLEFACLGFLVCGYLRSQNKPWWYACAVGLLIAVIDETIQLFTPGRGGMVSDVLLDWTGCWCGVWVRRLKR